MDSPVAARPAIAGVSVTPIREIGDVRGAVLHMMRNDSPEFVRFGELYFSEVLPGAVKAWKRHRAQTQHLAVPVGRVRFVIYDDREESGTRGRLQAIELGRPDAYVRLCIPNGLWYGFACLSPTPALVANCADLVHDPAEGEHRAMDDPTIPYSWTRSGGGAAG